MRVHTVTIDKRLAPVRTYNSNEVALMLGIVPGTLKNWLAAAPHLRPRKAGPFPQSTLIWTDEDVKRIIDYRLGMSKEKGS